MAYTKVYTVFVMSHNNSSFVIVIISIDIIIVPAVRFVLQNY